MRNQVRLIPIQNELDRINRLDFHNLFESISLDRNWTIAETERYIDSRENVEGAKRGLINLLQLKLNYIQINWY